jgi:hypothetical protein
MDGIEADFERRLKPEKAAGAGESLTEGIMTSADQERRF